MKDVIWNDALSVQIEEIDDDHRKLINLLNLLNHSVENGDSVEYIDAVVDELISLTNWHFKHEERLMIKYAYDGLQAHKKEHEELITSAKNLQNELQLKKRTLTASDIEFLEHWLTGHILGADMEMSAFLNERI